MKSAVEILLGMGRTAVVAALLDAEGECPFGLGFRELGRRSRIGGGALARELKNLEEAGLVTSRTVGHQRMISLNRESPLYRPVRDLVEHDVGLYRQVGNVLRECFPDSRFAFVFGSQAKGTDRPDSDLDLFVAGPSLGVEIGAALDEVAARHHRPINVIAFDQNDPLDLKRLRHPTLRSIMAGPKRMLFGEQGDVDELLQTATAPVPAHPSARLEKGVD